LSEYVPLGCKEVVAEARLGSEPDGVQHTVDVTPFFGECFSHRNPVFGNGDVELEHVDVVAEFAGGSLCELQRTAGTGEDDLGTFSSCELRNAERQRGVGENAGDHDFLAVEQTHSTDRR